MYNLNKTDKDFLYRKYIKLGLTPKESYNNVKCLVESLKFYQAKLIAQKLNEDEIRKKLRKRFDKICLDIEGKF